jgi:hypothetical protein
VTVPYDYETQDPTFREDLRASRVSVEIVARWLSDRGYPVIVRPVFERPSFEEMHDYSDDGDLEILQRIEVKQRTFDFTSKDNFPYPTLFVDNCHSYDNARPKPFAYVLLNKAMTHAFIVECRTFKHWKAIEVFDRKKKRMRKVYECPIGHATFVELPTVELPT